LAEQTDVRDVCGIEFSIGLGKMNGSGHDVYKKKKKKKSSLPPNICKIQAIGSTTMLENSLVICDDSG